MGKWTKLYADFNLLREEKVDDFNGYQIAIVIDDGRALRLVSCWNACTQFENPEQDIKKLIEVLTYSTHLLDDWSKLINEKVSIP
jgi:hypothetical protein